MLNKFVIGELLGEGAFGKVYLGWPKTKENKQIKENFVAIKMEDASSKLSTIAREAKILGRLNGIHGVLPVVWYGIESGIRYLVFRKLSYSMWNMVQNSGPMESANVTRIHDFLVITLEQIHSRGIIHADMSPSNIMFNDINHPYIIDFGLARDMVRMSSYQTETKTETQLNSDTVLETIVSTTDRPFTSTNKLCFPTMHPECADDMESLNYICMYALIGSISWSNIQERKDCFTKHQYHKKSI